MKFLLLNQCFYPDVMATAQQLTDLAVGLTAKGHSVTVIAGDRGYDDPSVRFPRRETWNGIKIIRIPAMALGKQSRWRRAVNFASFLSNCAFKLLFLPRYDVVVALTSPPLISFLGSLFVRVKGGKFFFWVMDLNPDEAIAAGWLKKDSWPARMLGRILRYSLVHAERIIALDRFMKDRIVAKGIAENRVIVVPPWAREDSVKFDPKGREAFRREHGLTEKFVVMYAGNHSPCHPLDTLLEAARRLSIRRDIAFCFVGGGSEHTKVRQFASAQNLENIICLPYQPYEALAGSLSAADLHTVVIGDEFVGIVHPCKLYNVLTIGSPFLYIGPKDSHVSEIAARSNGGYRSYTALNGNVETVVNHVLTEAGRQHHEGERIVPGIAATFSKQRLLPKLIMLLESSAKVEAITDQSGKPSYVSAAR